LYDAFGDESAGPQYVSYGVVLVAADKQADANSILAQVKTRFGASADDQLHCRVLFSGQQRKKSPWAGLNITEVFTLYSELMRDLNPLMIRKIVSIGKKSEFPNSISGAQWQHVDPNFIGPHPWSEGYDFGDKHIANLGAHGTMVPLSKWPGFDRVRFWPDPDTTPIETTAGRRQFSNMLSGFVDNGDGKEPPRVSVMYSSGPKPPLLQIADLVAYVSQRCAGAGYDHVDMKFKALNRIIEAEKIKIGIAPDGGIGINVPNTSLEFRGPA
jgi:hypothetical protein